MAAYFEKGSPAMAQLAAIVDRLEQMVDHAGLANLFYALEVVCSARVAWRWCGVGVGWAGQKWLATLLSRYVALRNTQCCRYRGVSRR